MPVIVPASAWDIWLDPTVDDRSELEAILQPNESVRLAIRPVSRLVNDVRNDGPELVEPVELVAVRATEPGFFD
jgi:putative SOS response-associated peptidase YedK